MNPIITITRTLIGTEETNAVNARELHSVLEIKKDFSSWIKTQIVSLKLEENVDYISLTQKGEREIGATIRKEYILTIDTAKHIAMASRSRKGKEVRAYFIEVEKQYRNNMMVQQTDQGQVMQAVLHSLQNIGEVIQTLGMQMERLDRRLRIYEEMEQHRREKARLRAQRYATGNGLVTASYEGRRMQFVKLVQAILKETTAPLNQSKLLIKAGYRRDDKTARKWLDEGIGIYWRVEVQKRHLIYSIIDVEQEVA